MKGLICMLIALAALPLAIAGESYDLNGFDAEPTQAVWLKPHDEARFEMLGGVHSVILENIDEEKNSADIKVFPFRIKANYATLAKGKNHLKADFDRDGKDDLLISLYDIRDGRAMIFFAKLATAPPTGSVVDIGADYDSAPDGQGVVEEESNFLPYALAGVVFLVIVSFLLRKKPRKK